MGYRTSRIIVAVVCILVILGFCFWLGNIIGNRLDQSNRTSIALQQKQLDSGCHRLNQLKVVSNQNSFSVYNAFFTTANGIGSNPAAKAFKDLLLTNAKEEKWVPLTNCSIAKSNPNYDVGTPVPFYIQLPPPNALMLGPNN